MDEWSPQGILELVQGLVALGWPYIVGAGLLTLIGWCVYCKYRYGSRTREG